MCIRDRRNRIISETDPLGAVRNFKYDGNDNLTESVDANGIKNIFAYDANNNLISQDVYKRQEVNSTCPFAVYQPKLPESVEKMRKK